jgi:protein TonB
MAVFMPTLLLGLARHGAGGFDATTAILIVLAAVAGYLVYDFIREAKGRSSLALVGAIIGHLLLVLFLSLDIPGRLGCNAVAGGAVLIEFEVAELEPQKPPEPEPEPEPETQPEPEPEPIPQIKPNEPPPKAKPKKAEEPPQQPVNPEPAPATRWDLTSTGTGNVIVPQGTGGEYGGTGKPDSKGTGKTKPVGDPKGDEDGTAAPWQPRSELFIKSMPDPLKVPKIDCPATAQLGVQGDVILKVQVARDGKIRSVKIVKGIGHGCDEVAVKALKGARFKPAIGTNGQAVDFELRYEYAFTVND